MGNYRVPILENYEFQPAILDKDLSTPPSPIKEGRYIVKATGIGDWAGHDNAIAWYNGAIWKFDNAIEGMITWAKDEDKFYFYTGSVWTDLTIAMGLGDMLKSTYDTDTDGIVDKAETIDDGAGNSASAIDVKDAVTKKHSHTNQSTLDLITSAFTSALKTSYDSAVTASHTKNADTKLDEGGANEVTAAQVKSAVTNNHTHSNKATLDLIEAALTTALKSNYDEAYTKRAQYDAGLGCLTFDI